MRTTKRVKSKRIGIIDLGTNSIRGFVFELEPRKSHRLLARGKEMVRLGDDVFTKGRISPAALRRTLDACESLTKLFKALDVTEVHGFGTSALRTAKNSARLIVDVKRRCGITLRRLSEKKEALYIGKGVIEHEPAIKGNTLIIDIGGGSIEVILCRGKEILKAESFKLGAAAVQQLYLKKTPPLPGSSDRLRHAVRNALRSFSYPQGFPIARVLGSSGSIRTLAKAIGGEGNYTFTAEELVHFISKIAGASKKQIGKNTQIEKKRVDLVLGAALALDEILNYFGVDKITTTPYALKDGIVCSLR